MIYITGTTSREYAINGFVFPKRSYTDEQIKAGKKLYLEFDDAAWEGLASHPIIKGLVGQRILIASSSPPYDQLKDVTELKDATATLSNQVTQLKAELTTTKAELVAAKMYEAEAAKVAPLTEFIQSLYDLVDNNGTKQALIDAINGSRA